MADCAVAEATERVRQMEQCFDVLQEAFRRNPDVFREDSSLRGLLRDLTRYYESGLWLQDYELDEKGLFPETLKRGVLSQDAVFHFLDQIQQDNGSTTQRKNWGQNHAESKNP